MTDGDPIGLAVMAVGDWLAANVAGSVAPFRFDLITGGHSNLTYLVTDADGARFVLRRPPLGEAGGRAHDVGREYDVIAALRPTAVPVPDALGVCRDEAVNGSAFYVMAHIDAHVIDNPEEAERCFPDAAVRRHAGDQIVDVMADMHRVDVDAVDLGRFARREQFLERQISRYVKVWNANKTRELPVMDDLARRLTDAMPPQRYTGIVHSDYRLGNVMIDDAGDLVAVLDWELWTLGDVLADVGFLLNNWNLPDDSIPLVWMEVPPTVAGGFPTRADLLERYARTTGFDVGAVEYYQAFQYWKVAALAEGVKRRYESQQMGQADVDFAHLDQRVIDLTTLAGDHLSRYERSSI